MKIPLIIFGIGKISKVLTSYFSNSNDFTIAGFTCDRNFIHSNNYLEYPLIPFDCIQDFFSPSSFQMHIAIGYQEINIVRANIYKSAKAKGYQMASYINPDSHLFRNFKLGENCFVADGVSIQPGVSIGNNVSIWSNSVIGHDSIINDHTWIAAGAVIGGNSAVGARTFIGLNTTIGNNIKIGDSCFLGARTLITKSISDNSVVIDRDSELLRLNSEQFLKLSKMK